jgi:hypothetical protein
MKRMLTRLAIIWREIHEEKSLWRTDDRYKTAVNFYHQKAYPLKNAVRLKLLACSILVTDELDKPDKLLPELCYMTLIIKRRVTSAKKLLSNIVKQELPLDCEVFEDMCLHLFDTQAQCINACPEEV